MLTELYCDKFHQERIHFDAGLNVIAGDDNAANSIGKSSALLAIEFAFGGNTYSQQTDIIENVGHHYICFCHSFKYKNNYFKRSTSSPDTVYTCDKQYKETEAITIQDFLKFLTAKYGITHYELTFRDFVGLFSRIYGKDNLNEKRPMSIVHNESGAKSIIRLMKIFDEYKQIEELNSQKNNAKYIVSTYTAAQNINIVSNHLNKKSRKERTEELNSCESEIKAITAQITSASLNLDNQKLEAIALRKRKLDTLELLLTKQKSKLLRLERSKNLSNEKSGFDIDQLSSFFPAIDIASIEKINEFHIKLSGILHKKIDEEIKSTKSIINDYSLQITEINTEISKVVNADNPISVAIDNLIRLTNQRDALTKVIYDSDKYEQVIKERKDVDTQYASKVTSVLERIQNRLNAELALLNENVTKGNNPPVFSLRENAYDFSIKNDTGAGSRYKSTILTDLCVMNLTDLPFVIHDTVLFKNIEDSAINNILLKYMSYKDRQVFIAFDHIASYKTETVKILRDHTVINITPNGNELYGKSWNKVK